MVYSHFVTEKLQIDNKVNLSQGRGIKLKVLENRVGLDGLIGETLMLGLPASCVK